MVSSMAHIRRACERRLIGDTKASDVSPPRMGGLPSTHPGLVYTNPDQVDGVRFARGRKISGVVVSPTRQTHTRWVYKALMIQRYEAEDNPHGSVAI